MLSIKFCPKMINCPWPGITVFIVRFILRYQQAVSKLKWVMWENVINNWYTVYYERFILLNNKLKNK